jgi:hypothetical protein
MGRSDDITSFDPSVGPDGRRLAPLRRNFSGTLASLVVTAFKKSI